jgi:thioredoxin 1
MNEEKIIEFYAQWCGPCKPQKLILEKLSREFGINVEYIDIDDYPEKAKEFGIRAVPSIVHLKNDTIIQRFSGFQSESILKEKILKKI